MSSSLTPRPAPLPRVLWAANVRTKPLAERIAAAHAGRFSHVSLFPIDVATWAAAGVSASAVRQQLEAEGLRIAALDPYTQWVPRWQAPAGYPDSYLDFVRFDEEAILRMADELGAESINCVEPFGVEYPAAELADALGKFGERAARHGIKIALEFMPISGIRDLAQAWEIASGLDAQQVGLTFDTWHYYRSQPNDTLLRAIPGARVFQVQLADARAALQAPTLTEDLLHHRLLPGDGELDLSEAVRSLRATGAYRSVGPELFSDRFDAMEAIEVGRAAGANLDRWTTP